MKLYVLLLLLAHEINAAQNNTNTTEATATNESMEFGEPATLTPIEETDTNSKAISLITAEEASPASITVTPTTAEETSTDSTATIPTTTEEETNSAPTNVTNTTPNTATNTPTTSTTAEKSSPTSAANTTESSTESSNGTSTESASTATAAATTTQQPSTKQNFTCQDGNATKFSLTGSFALYITYKTTQSEGLKTVPIEVPQTKQSNSTCDKSSTESLTFDFFNGWRITYIFQGVVSSENQLLSAVDKYYISNITVVYVHDEHLPNSATPQARVESKFSQDGYLEATSEGYYTCQANISLKINDDLTLTSADFKYKAFNDKGDINMDSGKVTECPTHDSSSSVVAIAVGAAVAGLVIIVLIVYLVWRKRSRKARYEHGLMWAGTSDNLNTDENDG